MCLGGLASNKRAKLTKVPPGTDDGYDATIFVGHNHLARLNEKHVEHTQSMKKKHRLKRNALRALNENWAIIFYVSKMFLIFSKYHFRPKFPHATKDYFLS